MAGGQLGFQRADLAVDAGDLPDQRGAALLAGAAGSCLAFGLASPAAEPAAPSLASWHPGLVLPVRGLRAAAALLATGPACATRRSGQLDQPVRHLPRADRMPVRRPGLSLPGQLPRFGRP